MASILSHGMEDYDLPMHMKSWFLVGKLMMLGEILSAVDLLSLTCKPKIPEKKVRFQPRLGNDTKGFVIKSKASPAKRHSLCSLYDTLIPIIGCSTSTPKNPYQMPFVYLKIKA